MNGKQFFRIGDLHSLILWCASAPDSLKPVFAKSIPIVVAFTRAFPVVKWLAGDSSSAHHEAVETGRAHLIRQASHASAKRNQ